MVEVAHQKIETLRNVHGPADRVRENGLVQSVLRDSIQVSSHRSADLLPLLLQLREGHIRTWLDTAEGHLDADPERKY